MNPLVEAFVAITADLRNFFAGMFQVNQNIAQIGQGMQGLEGIATRVFGIIAAAATAAFIGIAAEFESVQMRYEVLLGSTREAEALIGRLSTFAIKTPFEMPEINRAMQSMLAFGFTVIEAESSLDLLGNIAAVTGGDLAGLSNIFASIRTTNRAMLGDLNMLNARGIAVFDMLGKKWGVDANTIRMMASDGKILFRDIYDIMLQLGTGNGRMAGGMERLAQTFQGLRSTMVDSWRYVGKEIGDLFLPLAKDVVSILIVIGDYTRNSLAAFRGWNEEMGGWPAKVAATAVGVFAMAQGFVMLAPVVLGVAGSMAWMVSLPIAAFAASWRFIHVGVLLTMQAMNATWVVALAFFRNWTAATYLAGLGMRMFTTNITTYVSGAILQLQVLARTYLTVGYASRVAAAMVATATAATGWGLVIVGIGAAIAGAVMFGRAVVAAIDKDMWKQFLATLNFVWMSFKNLISIVSESSGLAGALRRVGEMARGIMNGMTSGIGANWENLVKTVFLIGAGVSLLAQKLSAMAAAIGGPIFTMLSSVFALFSSKTLSEDFAGVVQDMVTAVSDFALEVVIWTLIIIDNWQSAWDIMVQVAIDSLDKIASDPNNAIGKLLGDVRQIAAALSVLASVVPSRGTLSSVGMAMPVGVVAAGVGAASVATANDKNARGVKSANAEEAASGVSSSAKNAAKTIAPTAAAVWDVVSSAPGLNSSADIPKSKMPAIKSAAASATQISNPATSAAWSAVSWFIGWSAEKKKTEWDDKTTKQRQTAAAPRTAAPGMNAAPESTASRPKPSQAESPRPDSQPPSINTAAAAAAGGGRPSRILTDEEKQAEAAGRREKERRENQAAYRQSMSSVTSILGSARDSQGRFDYQRAVEAARRMREELKPPMPKPEDAAGKKPKIDPMLNGRFEFTGIEQAIKDLQTNNPNERSLEIQEQQLDVAKDIQSNTRGQLDAMVRNERRPNVAVAVP